MGAGGGEPLGPGRLLTEPPPWLGEDGRDSGIPLPPAKAAPRKSTRKKITSSYLINYLAEQGYAFRLNLCDDTVEVCGERISDVSRALMRCRLRDAGLGKYLAAADDAVIASAASQPYHPVLDYLRSLTWDQQPHISQLAAHFADTNGVMGLYLRKWLIGAVARAYTGVQNAVLVLDGAQGLGKSRFVRWLCPLPKLFVDAYINPDDKDCALLAVRSWIWEVSELGATTRRADVEALKGFLSREVFTVRAPYGRFEIVKPGLASFIGTVNNAFGVFSDSTGSRRYWATTLTAIDWAYVRNVVLSQVWAEAHAAYLSGESWALSPEEAHQAHGINESFAVPDPVEDLLRKYYQLDPEKEDKWLSSADILITLQDHGLGSNARANAMHLSATLKRLGHRKKLGGAKGKINGYVGIW
jgi:predicted P-loop ATPase